MPKITLDVLGNEYFTDGPVCVKKHKNALTDPFFGSRFPWWYGSGVN